MIVKKYLTHNGNLLYRGDNHFVYRNYDKPGPVMTAENVNVVFNDGSWAHGGDFGFMVDSSQSAWFNNFETNSLSAIIQFTDNFHWGKNNENIRYSYNSASIPDNQHCGHWYLNKNTHSLTAIISGFGSNSGNPSAYPIYFSFPYTDRNYGEENPILFSGLSGDNIGV